MSYMDMVQQIASRTGGNISIGVVGPVRSGKSTFIRHFMEELILPQMQEGPERRRVMDALPQSGSGRTIMTSQMQFVPDEAAELQISENMQCRIQMVDCVGYITPGALGVFEDDEPRMVRTPWHEEAVPFDAAAEEGTKRVIDDHSTLAIVVTGDGTATALEREQFTEPEGRVLRELTSHRIPFAVIVNTLAPQSEQARKIAAQLRETYDVPAVCMDVQKAPVSELTGLLQEILYEFPAGELTLDVPEWMMALPRSHRLWQSCRKTLSENAASYQRIRDYARIADAFSEQEEIQSVRLLRLSPDTGRVQLRLELRDSLYYEILSEETGADIHDQAQLMGMMKELVHAKKEYDRMAGALDQVRNTGYGVIAPSMEELTLEPPEMVRQGTQFGVRLRASAPSWHIMRIDVAAEVSPAVGTEKQSEKLVSSMLDAFRTDPESIWETEIFGRSLADLVRDGLSSKLNRMPETTQAKMRGALSRIVGDEGGGLMVLWL